MEKDRKEASSGTRWMLQQKFNMQLWTEIKKKTNQEIKGQRSQSGWGRTPKREFLLILLF